MSVHVGPAELREQVAEHGPVAYLVTVAPESRRPHVVSVTVRWEGDALVCGAGSRTSANVGAGADVTLVWPPAAGDDYSLIVDGPAAIVGSLVSVRPAGAVLHRVAGAAADEGPGCIPVTTLLAAPQEVTAVDEEHPNAAAVRRFLNAWFDGDFATWTALAADDIVIHMRGKPALNGSYRGAAGVTEFFEKFAALGIDGFEMEVEDVVADDRYALAIMRSTYQRGDEHLDLRNACAYRIDGDGRIAEVWNVSDNQRPESDFFTLADVGAAGLGVGLGPPA
ncbi:MAG TPA: nuclear transport factor 2 family protein [Acidimicrobiales bacterium]